jgi:NitT/TauT family transport system substrate-binding protein
MWFRQRTLIVATVLLASQLGVAPARALEKVVFGTGAPLSLDYSEIFFGMELGFFREEGIELSLVGFQGGVVLVPQVINKSVQFGLGTSLPGILALAQGKPIPVRVVYNRLRLSYADFAVLEDSPIQSLADLKGKRLGILGFNYATTTITQATLKRLGIQWQKDVEVLPVGTGPAAWRQLVTGQVDALNLSAAEDARMTAAGLKIRRIQYPEEMRKTFTGVVVAHNDTIRERPDLVTAVGRAMAKSTIACAATREACVRSFWGFDPTSRPTPSTEAEWVRNAVAVLEAIRPSISYFPDNEARWGSLVPQDFDSFIGTLKDTGLISRTDLPHEMLYTNQFVTSFNNFDPEEVRLRARDFATGQESNLPQ